MADSWDNDNEAWDNDPTDWDTINLWHTAGTTHGHVAAINANYAPDFASGTTHGVTHQIQVGFGPDSTFGVSLGNQMDWTRTQFVDSPFGFLVEMIAGIVAQQVPDFYSGVLLGHSGFGRYPWDDDGPTDSAENWTEAENGSSDQDWVSTPGDDGNEIWSEV